LTVGEIRAQWSSTGWSLVYSDIIEQDMRFVVESSTRLNVNAIPSDNNTLPWLALVKSSGSLECVIVELDQQMPSDPSEQSGRHTLVFIRSQ
jgi:hypothetical protein